MDAMNPLELLQGGGWSSLGNTVSDHQTRLRRWPQRMWVPWNPEACLGDEGMLGADKPLNKQLFEE